MPRILIVGAGATGQVYGRHLQASGAEVAFLVKDKYADEARRGFTLYPLSGREKGSLVRLEGFGVLSDMEQVAGQGWDQLWLCISATALRGDWLKPLLDATGDATIVALTPGLEDRRLLAEQTDPGRIVQGLITLIAWQAPLPGEHYDPPGVAWLFPPLSPTPLSGPPERVQAVVRALDDGGCPAKAVGDVSLQAALGSATLLPLIAGLEAAGWTFSGLAHGEWLAVACDAAGEAAAVVARLHGAKPGLPSRLVRPWAVRALLPMARWWMPMDLQVYLKYHFTKVGDQTRMGLDVYQRRAVELGLPHAALERLRATLSEL